MKLILIISLLCITCFSSFCETRRGSVEKEKCSEAKTTTNRTATVLSPVLPSILIFENY